MSIDFENFDRRDCTIITKAVKTGDPQNVKKAISGLRASGEDITENLYTTDRQGYSAIHHAVLQPSPSILQQLLVYADERCVNMESHDRTTALLLLCQQSSSSPDETEKLASLLAAGADPNRPKQDPFSLPLLCVLERKEWQAATMLLEAGAHPWKVDFEHSGWAPIYFALERLDIVQLILKKGGCQSRLLHQLFGHMLPPIPKEKMMKLYKLILPYIPDDVDVELLLMAAREPYVDIVIDMLPAVAPCHNAVVGRSSLLHFLRYMFPTLTRLGPLDRRRFLSAYFTSLKNNVFSVCDSATTLMPLVWTCNSVDSLKILLDEAECYGLPTADWRMQPGELAELSEHLVERPACSYCAPLLGQETESYDLLRVTAYTISTLDCFKSNFLMLLRAGYEPSMRTVATYIQHSGTAHNESLFSMPDFRLLSKISRNCCATGSCWFRQSFMIDSCRQLVMCRDESKSHSPSVLAFLYLGVDIRDVTSWLRSKVVHGTLGQDMVQVLNLFDPSCTASVLGVADRVPERAKWRRELQCEPLPLKHLSRLAFRSALGHCGIQEKLTGLKDFVPAALRDYICFKEELERLMLSRTLVHALDLSLHPCSQAI